MSDRIAVMREGRFVEIGSPLDLYNTPRSSFTAQLIGGANIIAGVAAPGPNGLTAVETPFGRLLSTGQAAGPVQVYVRPDKLALSTHDATSSDAINVIECKVQGRRFAGEMTEFDLTKVERGETQTLRCRMPTSLASGLGQHVRVCIDPVDIRIFAAEKAPTI